MHSTQTPRFRRIRAELILVGLTILWGSTFLITKNATRAISPGTILFLRFGIATLVLAPFFRPGLRLWLCGIELGIYLWAGFFTQTIGVQHTSAGRSAFVTSLNVIFVLMLAALVGRRIGLIVWTSAAIAFAGAASLCYDGSSANIGDAWTLSCALIFALFIIRLESATARFPALPLTSVQLLTVCLLATPWFIHDRHTGGAIPWVPVIYLAVACTAITTWLQVVGQRDVPAPQASIIFMLEPVFAAAFAFNHPEERFGWRGWLGAALILSATLLSQIPLLRRGKREVNP